MTDLSSLLACVKEAKGPDAALDREIARAFGWTPPGINPALWEGKETPKWWSSPEYGMPAFSAFLDAALALCERVLPGWDWSVHGHTRDVPPERHGWAGVRAPPKGIVSGTLYEANGYTPALALLAALLTAMEQKHD